MPEKPCLAEAQEYIVPSMVVIVVDAWVDVGIILAHSLIS